MNTGNDLNALRILNILKENSDKTHPMKISGIADRFEKIYGRKLQPRTVGNLLDSLSQEDRNVVFIGSNDENSRRTGVYYEHEFRQSELRLLIDMLLFSKLLTKKQTVGLIKKLTGLSSKHFEKYAAHYAGAVEAPDANAEVLKNISRIMKAINERRKICFDFAVYDFKSSVEAKNPLLSDIKERLAVTPIYTVYTEGKYFLVCKFPTSDKLYHYRIDKLKRIVILDESADDFKAEPLGDYARRHFNSFSGEAERITFFADTSMKNKIIEAFGADIAYLGEAEGRIEISVNAPAAAFKQWAVSNCDTVEVKSPAKLREELASVFTRAAYKYKKSGRSAIIKRKKGYAKKD